MLHFATPALLWAGAALAAVPLLLHFIAQRPAERAPLPTARFLAADARTWLRLRRTPSDVALLALRMLFVLLLAAALAGPAWLPQRSGTVAIVLLDDGAAMEAVWAEGVESARSRLLGAADGSALVVFGSSAVVHPASLGEALFDSLAAAGPRGGPSDYAVAFESVHALAAQLHAADSATLALVTRPRWESWSAGLAMVRAAAWPGTVDVVALDAAGDDAPRAPAAEPPARGALVFATPGRGSFVEAALDAIGWNATLVDAADAGAARPAALHVVAGGDAPQQPLLERARQGAVIVVAGEPRDGPLTAALPWRGYDAAPDEGGGDLHFAGGPRLTGAVRRIAGAPTRDARVIAVWHDGRPAAAAVDHGRGCLVYLAAPLEEGPLPLGADFPHALDRLANGCARVADGADGADGMGGVGGVGGVGGAEGASGSHRAGTALGHGPLDSGARALLADGRADGTRHVALGALAADRGGTPLWRWLLFAALIVAGVETAVAYSRKWKHDSSRR